MRPDNDQIRVPIGCFLDYAFAHVALSDDTFGSYTKVFESLRHAMYKTLITFKHVLTYIFHATATLNHGSGGWNKGPDDVQNPHFSFRSY